jgi:2-keto-4-pentenoate hydratase
MSVEQVEPDRRGAADVLWSISRGETIDGPPPMSLRSYDDAPIESGLPLQVAVIERWKRAGEQIGGYKIGWTSRAARDRGGPGFRPFGYVLARRVFQSGSVLSRGEVRNAILEPEICLTIGHRIAGEVTTDEARNAVSAVSPAFEVISGRLPEGVSLPVRIGNGLNNWGIVVGAERPPDVDLSAVRVEMRRDGDLLGAADAGPDVVDDPYLSLARVAAELGRHGLTIDPGYRVITGSLVPGVRVADGGTRFEATFAELGSVRLDWTD